MRKRAMVEGLESRRLMTATILPVSGPTETGAYIERPVNFFEPPEGGIAIRYDGPNGAGIWGGPAVGGRTGSFVLPSLKSDGSLRITGSDEADVITVESVSSYDERYTGNKPADSEYDFVHLIDPETGERFITSGSEIQNIDANIRNYGMVVDSSQRDLAYTEALPPSAEREESLAAIKSSLASEQKTLKRYETTKAQLAVGGFVKVTFAGVYEYYLQIPAGGLPSTARVTVDSGAGNDTVSISPNVPMKSTLYGGSGADVLTTGKKTASVFAGGGKDRLINRSVKGATLDGGQGADRYFNKTSADVNVIGRADGDQMIVSGGSIQILQNVFVTMPIGGGSYALRQAKWGETELTIVDYVEPTA